MPNNMEQEKIDIDTLQFADYNPREISEHDFKKLVQSIQRFGDLGGIVRNTTTGNLVGGHQRVRAFRELKSPSIIVSERFDKPTTNGTVAYGYVLLGEERFTYREVVWDAGFEKAANIAANRIQGQFDLDMLAKVNYDILQLENGQDLMALTGQTKREVDDLLDAVGAMGDSEEDETPEVDESVPAVSKLGEIYQLGKHRLMCGDATSLDDVTALMAGEKADLIWTDPPYNVSYEGGTKDKLTIQNDSFKDSEAFYDFLYLAFSNLNAVTKAGSSIYICHSDTEGFNFRKAMLESGWLLKQCIIWNKNSMVMGRQDYQWKHEPILYGWKEGGTHFFTDDRNLTTVWDFDKPTKSEEHPTMKPLALVKYAIGNSSLRDQLVLDTFAGSGSTLIAADIMGRVCNVLELDPKYCDVIRKRYALHIKEADWILATPNVA